jgi:hypothetical protein
MSRSAKRRPDQEPFALQGCPEAEMLQGSQLDAVIGGYGYLPAVQKPAHITDGTSNTISFAE